MSPDASSARRPNSRATLRDIAVAVNLDVSTVSKVLNERIAVRPETRDRIFREARRLRYQPNASARGLRLSRTEALGLLIPDFTNPVYAQIARGAMRQAEDLGYVMLVAEIDEENPGPAYRKLVRESRIDGFVVATARDAKGPLEELDQSEIPHIFVNRQVAGRNRSVILDDEAGAALAADTLIEAGHRHLGLVGGPPSVDTARRRSLGFQAACREAGLSEPSRATGPYTLAGGRMAMQRLLAETPRPTGVFASNTLSGLGALNAVLLAGLAVPDDISVITFDDEVAAFTYPALTAIRMPLTEMGTRAVQELHRVLHGHQPRDTVIDTRPELVWRDSVSAPYTTSYG